MAKKSKAPRNSKRRKTLEVINVKLSRAKLAALKTRAKKYAAGNLSAFLRHAGMKYTPKKGEEISSAA